MTDNPKAKHSERRERLMRQFMNGTTDAVFEEAGQHYDRLGAYADELAAERDELAATLEESIGETVREHDEAEALRAKLQAAERVIAEVRATLADAKRDNDVSAMALGMALDRYDRASTPDGKGSERGR